MHNYEVLIKTNLYAGNLNQELVAFVFGQWNYSSQPWIEKLGKDFIKTCGQKLYNEISEALHLTYDEHGATYCNDKEENNLVVFFKEDPSFFRSVIFERLQAFPKALAESFDYAPKNLKISSFEIIKLNISKESLYQAVL